MRNSERESLRRVKPWRRAPDGGAASSAALTEDALRADEENARATRPAAVAVATAHD